jgi:hypothetical protein
MKPLGETVDSFISDCLCLMVTIIANGNLAPLEYTPDMTGLFLRCKTLEQLISGG